jgi:glyoxylase-like metal-dependent hydrolase (beta-lactamase superfamily II)
VDAGPSGSSAGLLDAIHRLGLVHLDFILLTHIHIDHAGGLAPLLDSFPGARVVCHEKAVPHLADPSKLWKASRKVLGEVADLYGSPDPVSLDRLIPHTEARIRGLRILETPGHAAHHLCFTLNGNLFAGEAGGNYLNIEGEEYLRPATPPVFFLDECLESVDRLLALDDQPIYYAHFGRGDSSYRLLRRFRAQLLRWLEIIRQAVEKDPEKGEEQIIEILMEKDPDMAIFSAMTPEVQEREKFFMTNSVRGYLGFLKVRG